MLRLVSPRSYFNNFIIQFTLNHASSGGWAAFWSTAIFICIYSIGEGNYSLQLLAVIEVTEGIDAQAEVTVRLVENGRSVNGQAADTDTMVAAARAYIGALNKLIIKREKKALMNNSASK